jgi:hypothetical protein
MSDLQDPGFLSAMSVKEHLNKNEQYDKTLNDIGGFGKF